MGLLSERKARRFVVFTSQRTGSTLLVRSLDSSPSITCAGELFHTGRGIHHPEFQYAHQWLGSASLGRMRDVFVGRQRVRSHLQNFYSTAGNGVAAVGFKLMLSQTRRFPAVKPALLELGVQFLYLVRSDVLATALSFCRAKATGVFHSDRAGRMPKHAQLVVSEDEFARVLRKCKSDKDELINLHQTHGGLLLQYENMVSDWDAFVETIGTELGIAGLRVSKALSRLKSGVDAAVIANERELVAKFAKVSLQESDQRA
jgi:LPS sulfotransferase NodH